MVKSIWRATKEVCADFWKYTLILKLNDFLWDIRYRTTHRYHILKLGFDPGWKDADTRLLYAMFAVLCEFMEKEVPTAPIDWESDPDTKVIFEELKALHKWWREIRPNRKSAESPPVCGETAMTPFKMQYNQPKNLRTTAHCLYLDYLDRLNNEDDTWYKEDTEMMMRLVKVRSFMWT